jgi:hypothetical protein
LLEILLRKVNAGYFLTHMTTNNNSLSVCLYNERAINARLLPI